MANIFTSTPETSGALYMKSSKIPLSDYLWNDDASRELNTYRNLHPIALNIEPTLDHGQETTPTPDGGVFVGRHSLFNVAAAVGDSLKFQEAVNAPLFDHPAIRARIRQQSDCSVKALVNASERGEMGRAVYQYADFMFCKHLGKISNNYLITLRRFPHPAGDHINSTNIDGVKEYNGHMPDIGRLVTWLGTPGNDMSSILKYDVNLPYKEMRAEIQPRQTGADTGGGLLGGLINIGTPSYRQKMLDGSAGQSGVTFINAALSKTGLGSGNLLQAPPNTSWAYYRDLSKAYGPVDSIARTHRRSGPEEDGGIKFEHNITLTFDYELRSFDGINTRAAMLDLLANILAVTFTNASYWPGAIHGNGAAQSNLFANLPIFHMQTPLSFTGVKSAVFDSLKNVGSLFNNGNPIGGLSDVLKVMENLGKSMLTGMVGGALNALGRPEREGLNSLLNFSPTGVWHLMIGNPKHPILSMGNMILDNCTIEHYGPLGLDDFPTGLKVTITLKHGMPRDNLKIEHMYMNGDFRIYQHLGNLGYSAWEQAEELYDKTEQHKSSSNIEEYMASTNRDQQNTDALYDSFQNKARILTKYFGTADAIDIQKAIKEAHMGSEPRSLKSEEDAQARVKQNSQETGSSRRSTNR